MWINTHISRVCETSKCGQTWLVYGKQAQGQDDPTHHKLVLAKPAELEGTVCSEQFDASEATEVRHLCSLHGDGQGQASSERHKMGMHPIRPPLNTFLTPKAC